MRRFVWSRNLVNEDALAHWEAVVPQKKRSTYRNVSTDPLRTDRGSHGIRGEQSEKCHSRALAFCWKLAAVRAHYYRGYTACLLLAILMFREGHLCVCLTVILSCDVRYSGVPNFHFQSSKVCDDFPMYYEHLKPTVRPSLVRTAVQFLSKYNGPLAQKFLKHNFKFLVFISTNNAQHIYIQYISVLTIYTL